MLSRLCLFILVKHAMVAKRRNLSWLKYDCYNITYRNEITSDLPIDRDLS
jgi:hypothetical protein